LPAEIAPGLIVLGIETSTRLGSASVVEVGDRPGAGEPLALAEVTRDSGLRHGASLLGLVDEALGQAGLDLETIDVVAVSIGPGSFTGLRVALATSKGLVLGTRTRLVGVPTLAALAEAALARLRTSRGGSLPAGTVLAPCIDARRGEVYGACFSLLPVPAAGGPIEEIEPPAAFAPADFARRVAARADVARAFVLGDGATRHRATIEAELPGTAEVLDEAAAAPSGVAVARIGARGGGSPGDSACLAPLYVRASEAERNRAAALDAASLGPGEAGSRSR